MEEESKHIGMFIMDPASSDPMNFTKILLMNHDNGGSSCSEPFKMFSGLQGFQLRAVFDTVKKLWLNSFLLYFLIPLSFLTLGDVIGSL